MDKLELCIMDITQEENTSGVDRYVEVLTENLMHRQDVHFVHIQLVESKSMLFVRKFDLENSNVRLQIPLPIFAGGILEEFYWIKKYAHQVFSLVKNFLPQRQLVIHVNTLNLIDLAVFIKSQIPKCKIVTHLHCIPWKSLYNKDKEQFNVLYSKQSMARNLPISIRKKLYVRLESEWRAYHEADDVICVTKCARKFLANIMERKNRVEVIPNGAIDILEYRERSYQRQQACFSCLYAGVVSESKGVDFIFKALEKLERQGRNIKLLICGQGPRNIEQQLRRSYPSVTFEYCGLLPFEKLERMYLSCDMGIIPSLQEQSSFVAIEMMKYGLPIVTTAVDGLDEMFDNQISALKIKPKFSLARGLSVDTEDLANAIAFLCDNIQEREKIGKGARAAFVSNHLAGEMIEDTIKVYRRK